MAPRVDLYGHEGPLGAVGGFRRPVSDVFGQFVDPLGQGGPGRLLKLGVHGGGHLQAAVVDHLGAVALLEVLQDPVDEITARRSGRTPAGEGQRLDGRLRRRLRLDETAGHHASEHHPLAGLGALRVAQWIVTGGGFGQTGQQGRLRDGQLTGRLSEKGPRRRGDTLGAGAEIDLIDVGFEYFALAELGLDLQGDQQFPEFTPVSLFETEKQVLGQLLGDGRGPLDAPRDEGAPERLDEPHLVDAVVLPEAVILRRQNRIEKHDGDLFQGHVVVPADLQDALAVGGIDLRGRYFDDAPQGLGHAGQVTHAPEEKKGTGHRRNAAEGHEKG